MLAGAAEGVLLADGVVVGELDSVRVDDADANAPKLIDGVGELVNDCKAATHV